MYLQLAGPSPLDTAENPLAPGAPTYKYDAMYLGQSEDIILPDALFPANVEGYANALKSLVALYEKFGKGKKTPAEVVAAPGMSEPVTIAAAIATAKLVAAGLGALGVALRGVQATAARNRITQLYNNNEYNVQNLNRMTARQVAEQITRIDNAITLTPRTSFGQKMALSRFRLIYQQRFDRVSGGGGFGNLPGWVLPAALGLGALLFLRGRK
jgi:hypothetical protein